MRDRTWRRARLALCVGASACAAATKDGADTARPIGSTAQAAVVVPPAPTPNAAGVPAHSPEGKAANVRPGRGDTLRPRMTNACGGVYVTVTVTRSAIAASGGGTESALRSLAAGLSEAVRPQLLASAPQISPAIRAFRLTVRDAHAADTAIARLMRAPSVESAELDDCSVRTQ